jgi:CHAT domain-containing protein
MPGKVVCLLTSFLLFASADFSHAGSPVEEPIRLYRLADRLYNLSVTTAKTDSLAQQGFQQVVDWMRNHPAYHNDTLLFQSFLKRGTLLDVGLEYAHAKEDYLLALQVCHLGSAIPDSLCFRNLVFLGSSYYNLNDFDSASDYLHQAERFTQGRTDTGDQARLYNVLGALYYDNGNYYQSKNYLSKGLDLIRNKLPLDTLSLVSIETNVATACFRLGQYRESIGIYHSILRFGVYRDYIYLNLGRAEAAMDSSEQAMACFRRANASAVPGVLNEMAATELHQSRPDSARRYLDQFDQLIRSSKVRINTLDIGIHAFYRAAWKESQRDWEKGLGYLQQALMLFSGNFRDPDVRVNPRIFAGTFAYYRLFEALFQKATVWDEIYREHNQEPDLKSALSAYQSTISLLDYIEKNYETDDAKILLKKKSREIYQAAFADCLLMHQLHPAGGYLEQAFAICEQNKASILSSSLREREYSGNSSVMLQERNIKYNIARLDEMSSLSADSQVLESNARSKAAYEMSLARIEKQLETNDRFYQFKYGNDNPSIPDIQRHLGKTQLLVNFYETPEALHLFLVSDQEFRYCRIDSVARINRDLQDWLQRLKSSEIGRRFIDGGSGTRLYLALAEPIRALMPRKDQWIIIPDGLLYYLPFESLPGPGEHYLLEEATISYQFSSRFVVHEDDQIASLNAPYRVLSFAPFAKSKIPEGSPDYGSLAPLPASSQEIDGLPGEQFLGSHATKTQFLSELNKYPVLHLATHAVADVAKPSGSFVAFYPEKKSAPEDDLFLEELYGLNMDATRLVIISACETGEGELVNNEGVLSLARAFVYAGCSSVVNSLWKADDRSTSIILRQFHEYLRRGYPASKALQRAKLDYLHGVSAYRSPDYWSHLILLGNPDVVFRPYQGFYWRVLAVVAAMGILVGLIGILKKRKSRDRMKELSRSEVREQT